MAMYTVTYTKQLQPEGGTAFSVSAKLEYEPEPDLGKALTFLSTKPGYERLNPRAVFEKVAATTLDRLWGVCQREIDTAVDAAWLTYSAAVAQIHQVKQKDAACTKFALAQATKVQTKFTEACKTWSADAKRRATPIVVGFSTGAVPVKKVVKNPDGETADTGKLAPAAAFTFYTDANPLSFSVNPKFVSDHMDLLGSNKGLTGGEAKKLALDRFSKKGSTTSSWLDLSTAEVIKKVSTTTKRAACTHQGKQQIALLIKVDSVTVTVSELTAKEIKSGRFQSAAVKRGSETVQVTTEVVERPVEIKVIGPWNPLTGDVDVYHYEKDTTAGTHDFLPKYLDFVMDGNRAVRPVATK